MVYPTDPSRWAASLRATAVRAHNPRSVSGPLALACNLKARRCLSKTDDDRVTLCLWVSESQAIGGTTLCHQVGTAHESVLLYLEIPLQTQRWYTMRNWCCMLV